MVTETQVQLIRDSWERVMPVSREAGQKFYERLFEIAPETKPLFEGDLAEQVNKLMAALNLAITSLNNLEKILPTLKTLGAKHKDYGVIKSHYSKVGEALIWTLETSLGEAFTDEVKEAWLAVYGVLSSVMTEAAGYEDSDSAPVSKTA